MKIAHEIYQNPTHKVLTVAILRDLESGVADGEITYSRMVEIINVLASSKINEWKRYSEDYERWSKSKFESDMDRAMSRPNKPEYFRANND